MTAARLPKALRERVSTQARHRCGYCLTAEAIVGTPMEIDHISPRTLGGPAADDNLWLACSLCNDHKADQIAAADLLTGEIVPLFNPRHEVWTAHFAWTTDGLDEEWIEAVVEQQRQPIDSPVSHRDYI